MLKLCVTVRGSEEENGKGREKVGGATIHDECKFPTKKLRALKRPVLSHKVDLIKQGCENNVVKQMSKS